MRQKKSRDDTREGISTDAQRTLPARMQAVRCEHLRGTYCIFAALMKHTMTAAAAASRVSHAPPVNCSPAAQFCASLCRS
eukprot:6155810-Amphidinium_carterae.1